MASTSLMLPFLHKRRPALTSHGQKLIPIFKTLRRKSEKLLHTSVCKAWGTGYRIGNTVLSDVLVATNATYVVIHSFCVQMKLFQVSTSNWPLTMFFLLHLKSLTDYDKHGFFTVPLHTLRSLDAGYKRCRYLFQASCNSLCKGSLMQNMPAQYKYKIYRRFSVS